MENANEYIRILDGYAGSDPMRILYDLGYKPETIKESIYLGLSKFLRDNEHLKKNAFQLAGLWCGILVSHKNDVGFDDKILSILKILNEAYDKDRDKSMCCIRYWMPHILQSGSRFWSQLKSQQDLKALSLEDFLEASLGQIGQCIEGLSKPYLCMLLHLNKIRDSKANVNEAEKIGRLDLGNIIEELITNAFLSNLLTLQLHSLKLHNWRNIAYHHNSRIKNGEIIVEFKSKSRELTFTISRKELFEVSLQVYSIFKVLKLSLDLFIEDHQNCENEWLDDKSDILIRDESLFNDFRIQISSQGFKIESIDVDLNTIRMVLSDLGENLPVKVRAIHSSQFLQALWAFSNKKILEIEYRTKKGQPVLISSTSSEICSAIHSNEDIKKLAPHVNFNFLNLDILREFDPFDGLTKKISVELRHRKYYSQEHEEIDIETYISKLTLSIFSNYLVFLNEGVIDESIEIKYFNDGCLLTGKINNKNVLARVPAPIDSSELQEILLECVNKTVENYKNSTLLSKYIVEAKQNDLYIQKRMLLRTQID